MKKIAIIIVIVLMSTVVKAQNHGRLSINVVVPQLPTVPEEARAILETKLQQVATQYGFISNGLNNRFVMTTKVNITSKEVTPTTPVRILHKMDVTLFIGDVIENKIYESVMFNVVGLGQSETQSMIKAFDQIKPANPKLKEFVENAERKIVEYYTNNCQYILAEAYSLAQQSKYDSAIAKLMVVPEVCKECYGQCLDMIVEVYQSKIDNDGALFVQQARNKWIAARDYAAAIEALSILSEVNPKSKANSDANMLVEEINSHLRELEATAEELHKKEWDFAIKQYNERVNTQRKLIDAARDVGVAFGKNQPESITRNIIQLW